MRLEFLVLRFGESPSLSLVAESLIILGWVVNWRPLEIVLYEWRPIMLAQTPGCRSVQSLKTLAERDRTLAVCVDPCCSPSGPGDASRPEDARTVLVDRPLCR
jgi:hypothetical protein